MARSVAALLALSASSAFAGERPNVLFIAVDDLRPQFGRVFRTPEVKTPHMDAFFLEGGGTAMARQYVQIAVCGPSRASMLTSRRPDTTTVGPNELPIVPTGAAPTDIKKLEWLTGVTSWCWCQRTNCSEPEMFMTLPTYFRQNGYVTAGAGKLFHPDACGASMASVGGVDIPQFDYGVPHKGMGDDPRAWSYGEYGYEGQGGAGRGEPNSTQEQFGTIPGPGDSYWAEHGLHNTLPNDFGLEGNLTLESPLLDEEQTDGMLATNTVERLANFSRDGIGKAGAGKPFFLSVGFHKPHTPWIIPQKWYDMYDEKNVSLPPNPRVPAAFKEENWVNNGNAELAIFADAATEFGVFTGMEGWRNSNYSFANPMNDRYTRHMRRGYFAAVSFIDAQVGRVTAALEKYSYKDNTVVALWGDHGYHLGDTNSWCKCTNFESATRSTMLWRVPGQTEVSKGYNTHVVEALDIFPTLIDLAGLPKIPKCHGIDQHPTVLCLQGASYAAEFLPALGPIVKKSYAFSQWPYPVEVKPVDHKWRIHNHHNRMGYTVRSEDGFRYTEYVIYDKKTFNGTWTDDSSDPELYDYNVDPWETTNFAGNASYTAVIKRLKAVLRRQYVTGPPL